VTHAHETEYTFGAISTRRVRASQHQARPNLLLHLFSKLLQELAWKAVARGVVAQGPLLPPLPVWQFPVWQQLQQMVKH